MVGSWGERSESKTKSEHSVANREAHYRQVMVSPAQIIALCEATPAVQDMLEQEPNIVAGRPQLRRTGTAPDGNVKMRDWF